MARVWVTLPGGRAKRFKSTQTRHGCRKRRHGRPSVGRGPCFLANPSRALRRQLRAALRRAAGDPVALAELAAGVVSPPRIW